MKTKRKPTILESIGITKKFPEINERVKLNDRHKTALGKRDWRSLYKIAKEYDVLQCPTMVNILRAEAKTIRRTRVVHTDIYVGAGSDITTPSMAVTP